MYHSNGMIYGYTYVRGLFPFDTYRLGCCLLEVWTTIDQSQNNLDCSPLRMLTMWLLRTSYIATIQQQYCIVSSECYHQNNQSTHITCMNIFYKNQKLLPIKGPRRSYYNPIRFFPRFTIFSPIFCKICSSAAAILFPVQQSGKNTPYGKTANLPNQSVFVPAVYQKKTNIHPHLVRTNSTSVQVILVVFESRKAIAVFTSFCIP